MRDVYQYFDLIAGVAEGSGAESVELEFDSDGQVDGTVDGAFYFYDGSRLEFTDEIVIEKWISACTPGQQSRTPSNRIARLSRRCCRSTSSSVAAGVEY